MQSPVTQDVAACFAQFYFGGKGPSHTRLTNAFKAAGYSEFDSYDPSTSTPNKQTRVQNVLAGAIKRPEKARDLLEALLIDLRIAGQFAENETQDSDVVSAARALRRAGWELSTDGYLAPLGDIDLATGGRLALDEQINRLRRATDDPGLLIGSSKDLLEATAKFVLKEVGMEQPESANFGQLWYIARERLGVLPESVTSETPGAKHIKSILGGSWMIAEKVNELRNLQGAGHGRTLPTGVTAEVALLVVRQACLVAEFMLTTLDRLYGRSDN